MSVMSNSSKMSTSEEDTQERLMLTCTGDTDNAPLLPLHATHTEEGIYLQEVNVFFVWAME